MENKVIAVCTTNLQDETIVERLLLLQKEAKAFDCKLLIVCTTNEINYYNNEDDDEEIFLQFNFAKCDAIIIFSEVLKHEKVLKHIVAQGKKNNIPVISFEKKLEGAVNVMVDYVTSFELLVKHVVIDHKAKKVDFMSGIPDNSFSQEREDVYKKVLAEQGIEFDENRLGYGYFWEDPCEIAMDKLLDYDTPEAVICANDTMAITACKKLAERGLRVPEDVIVTGYDGIIQGRWNEPQLTTCSADFTVMAQKMMAIFNDFFEGKEINDEYYIPYQYEVGASCGCKKTKHFITPETIFSMYDYEKRHSLYQMDMYKMQAELSKKDSTMQLANIFHGYMNFDGYLIVDDNIPEFALGLKKSDHEDRDLVRVLVRRRDREIEVGTVIRREEIIPNLEASLLADTPLVVMPIHSPSKSVGYLAVNIKLEKLAFATLILFNHAAGTALDTFKTQKSLKKVNRSLEELNTRMNELYVRDPLTKLFNRRGFYNTVPDLMKNCYAKETGMFVASIDLDDLKTINDTYGHAEGDNAIKTFGNALLVNADKDDVCARFGGDEFVVVGVSKNAKEAGEKYIKNIEKYLNNYNRDSGKPYEIRASVGLVDFMPESNSQIDEFILKADRIMYANKQERKAFRSRVRTVGVPTPEE